ncbi:hypothetical protein SAMN05518672_103805 [Chitinophaga sp. CF118]|uniref:hypothetical protein n=1 Tax=Chitinophaga sp. CF118 TaxID=1884367 RepID=UPI0008EF50F1|nr:hypothetical protein [Chitinophaga sp. CF118]SFD90918.1 hypothetical protein SAMN05518672_103805 [Chitinophaga sp. CF118]
MKEEILRRADELNEKLKKQRMGGTIVPRYVYNSITETIKSKEDADMLRLLLKAIK